ncbi:hypothetical protein Vqi01_21690 [Micromonospora qiuiae]|uniref:Uncharacterized protein n=1 Tax=Micromonospora qiuiae TaxID=502268 RepID=A0ABQ4JA10_9ACTN|nr:hypothetical protein Vqi01_21690 [Micromonospora qiuiae]
MCDIGLLSTRTSVVPGPRPRAAATAARRTARRDLPPLRPPHLPIPAPRRQPEPLARDEIGRCVIEVEERAGTLALGHANVAFTMKTYVHSQDEALKAAGGMLGAVYATTEKEAAVTPSAR